MMNAFNKNECEKAEQFMEAEKQAPILKKNESN